MKLYINYWRRMFDYKGYSELIEILNALIGNFLIIIFLNIIGFFIPVTWENSLVNLLYAVKLVMIFPSIALLVRITRRFIK